MKQIFQMIFMGLKVLLSQGIRPDYHVEVENTFGQADILARNEKFVIYRCVAGG